MIRAVTSLLLSIELLACAPSAGVSNDGHFDPVGVWQSRDGFVLKIEPNGRYQACSSGICVNGVYDTLVGGDELALRGFMKLTPAQAFIAESEAYDPTKKACGDLRSKTDWCRDDLVFFDSVADRDAASVCGQRECTVIGNVETDRGVLYRVGPNRASLRR
jgi:hypothetical protein